MRAIKASSGISVLAAGRSTGVEFPLDAEISDNRVVTDELKPPPNRKMVDAATK